MKRSDLNELHYISPIENLNLICQQGILSHANSKQISIKSVALESVQNKRSKKLVPNGRPLHDYANLYICARNPMMYKRRSEKLVVVRINTDVLNLTGVVIADGNAASEYTAFWPSPSGLEKISKDPVFAESWDDNDQIEKWRKSRIKCSEALVPEKIDPRFILGFYVPNIEMKNEIINIVGNLPVTIDAHLFFRD